MSKPGRPPPQPCSIFQTPCPAMRLSKEFNWLMRRSSVPENVSFPYSPLDQSKDEIRLLHLQPRQPGRALSCRLFTTSISKVDNEFYALSYTWGRPPAPCQLRINGRRFNVRNSLWSFLRSFSKQIQEPVLIWIDAICVDQNATSERNHQVAMMHEIYSRAYKVCVWLGSLQANDDRAHSFIKAVLGDSDFDHTNCFPNRGDSCPETKRFAKAHRQLTRCEYFQRLWVIQEMLLAKEVDICIGNYIMPWTSWTNFWQGHLSPREPKSDYHLTYIKVPSVWYRLKTRREHRSDISATIDIGALVTEFGSQKCLDPHDRVYALLGLANPPVSFNVDYKHLLSHIFREVHNGSSASSEFHQTFHLAWTLCFKNLDRGLTKRPETCSCAVCGQGMLRVSAPVMGIVDEIRPCNTGAALLSPLLHGKLFECINVHVERGTLTLASLTDASGIRLSDTIYELLGDKIGNVWMGIAVAVSNDDTAHFKPCIYYTASRRRTNQRVWNSVRAHYCILMGLLSDRSLTLKVESSRSTDGSQEQLPSISFQGPFGSMFEWLSAFNNANEYLSKQTLNLTHLCERMNIAGYRSITEIIRPACKGLGMRFEHDTQ